MLLVFRTGLWETLTTSDSVLDTLDMGKAERPYSRSEGEWKNLPKRMIVNLSKVDIIIATGDALGFHLHLVVIYPPPFVTHPRLRLALTECAENSAVIHRDCRHLQWESSSPPFACPCPSKAPTTQGVW